MISTSPDNRAHYAREGENGLPSSQLKVMNYMYMCFFLAGRLAQLVERRTREHNVSGYYRCGFVSPAGQLKIINCLSDDT